jgi:hypothetical protein
VFPELLPSSGNLLAVDSEYMTNWIGGAKFPHNLLTDILDKFHLLITKCFDDISITKGSPMWAYCPMLIRSQTAQTLGSHVRSKLGSVIYLLKNSVTLVRERTIPTEPPPHVGEVSVKFCG